MLEDTELVELSDEKSLDVVTLLGVKVVRSVSVPGALLLVTEDGGLLVVKRKVGTVLDVKVDEGIGAECTGGGVDEDRVDVTNGLANEETE